MKGSKILLTVNPMGRELEGMISGTPKPGTCMQIVPGTVAVNGRHTWQFYQPSADGDPRLVAVLLEDRLQGKGATDAYVDSTRGFLYVPLPGDELNMLVRDISGTGDTHTSGDRLQIGHADGKLIAQGTSANAAPFQAMETVAAPTTDILLWCQRT